MKKTTILILVLGLLNCSLICKENGFRTRSVDSLRKGQPPSPGLQTDYQDYSKLESYLEKDKIDASKILSIDYDCAVLIDPTDQQMGEMQKQLGEESFYAIADDNNFYQGLAIRLMDSLGIKTVTAEKSYIKFIGQKSTWTLNIRKNGLPAWNLIFFKKNKAPEIISTIDLTKNQIREYFETIK